MPQERGRICGIENCRSRRYHVGEDGYTYCSNGHRSETQVITVDDDLAGASARRTRKAAEVRETEVVAFDGRQALELYLQCFQLVLWKQVHWLIHTRGYPVELEIVVHDLWQLRLQLLRKLLQDIEVDDAPSRYFSSQGESEDDSAATTANRKIKIADRSNAPRLIESVSICYIGLVLLRLPVVSYDVQEWVLADNFPYMNASKAIPKPMRLRLPAEMLRSFSAQTGLGNLEDLHDTSMSLAGALKTTFDMDIPKLNHALILYRFMNELCLPIHTHPSTLTLTNLLSLPLDFAVSTSRYSLLSSHPELQLLANLIVTVKLLYPFDNTARHPSTANEPGALKLDWTVWNELYAQAKDSRGRLRRQASSGSNMTSRAAAADMSKALLEVTEADVLDMSGKELDAYLEWYGRTWIEDEDESGVSASQARGGDVDFRNALFNMFPIARAEDGATQHDDPGRGDEHDNEDSLRVQRIKAVMASLAPVAVRRSPSPSDDSEGDGDVKFKDSKNKHSGKVLRPGSLYKQYRNWAEVPEVARPFFEAAASLVCLDVRDLVRVVFQMEMRVRKWVRAENRAMDKGKGKGHVGREREDAAGGADDIESSPR